MNFLKPTNRCFSFIGRFRYLSCRSFSCRFQAFIMIRNAAWKRERVLSSYESQEISSKCPHYLSLLGLVFCNSIHLEVASDSFSFLINSSWLLVFILLVFFMIFSGFNLYCWKGIHFS